MFRLSQTRFLRLSEWFRVKEQGNGGRHPAACKHERRTPESRTAPPVRGLCTVPQCGETWGFESESPSVTCARAFAPLFECARCPGRSNGHGRSDAPLPHSLRSLAAEGSARDLALS